MARVVKLWRDARKDWLKHELAPFVVLQVLLLVIACYGAAALISGHAHPVRPFDTVGFALKAAFFMWSAGSFAAIIGMLRARWWAFFLEILLLWSLVAMVLAVPSVADMQPAQKNHSLPLQREFYFLVEVVAFAGITVALYRMGIRKWRDQQTKYGTSVGT